MDDLTPPLLIAIREIRWQLMNGRSLKESLMEYLRHHHCEFALKLNELWSLKMQGQLPAAVAHFPSHRAQALWDLIERGHQGQPILEPLNSLEEDVEAAATFDLEMHVATLPFKALLPLMAFQFPAFAILLIGPLLRELSRYSMLIMFTILGLSLVSRPAPAETLTALALKKISQARKAGEIRAIQTAFDELRIQRMACDLQLKERAVPAACYKALQLEQMWGLQMADREKSVRMRIDQRCAEAAANFKGLNSNLKELSPSCRQSVVRAKELREYKNFEAPAAGFGADIEI